MSKNITIQEGGTAKQLSVSKMRIGLSGGGDSLWVPKSELLTSHKYISENGAYQANSDDCFGYDQVTVSVASKEATDITGKGRDGNEYHYHVDKEGDTFEETKVPSKIEITQLPLINNYNEGETIDYSGLAVTAYDGNNVSMGEVPFSELILPVKTAIIGAWDGSEWISSDGQIASIMVTFSLVTCQHRYLDGPILTDTNDAYNGTLGTWYGRPATIGSSNIDDQFTVLFLTRYNGNLYAMRTVGKDDFSLYAYYNNEYEDPQNWYNGWRFIGGTNYHTKTYFTGAPWDEYITNVPESLINPNNVGSEGFLQSVDIPVQWVRPGDGKILETSYSVYVKPSQMPTANGTQQG